MTRDRVLAILREQRPLIAQRFRTRELALFGSAARDELRSDSDIDILVDFDGPATVDGYFGLKDYLEEVLQRPVDLVTASGLKPRARLQVERDLIRVT
jgi:predicted nucleotidyltransferase